MDRFVGWVEQGETQRTHQYPRDIGFQSSTQPTIKDLARWIEPYTVWALQHNSYETMTGNSPQTGWLAMVSAILSIALLLTIAIIWMQRSER